MIEKNGEEENPPPLSQAFSRLQQEILLRFENLSSPSSAFIRVEIPILPCNLLGWLHQQKNPFKLYWSNREKDFAVAGAGQIDRIHKETPSPLDLSELQQKLSFLPTTVRYYGGMAFNPRRQGELAWNPFGAYHFFLPEIEILQTPSQTRLCYQFRLTAEALFLQKERVIQRLKTYSWETTLFSSERAFLLENRQDFPSFSGWEKNIVTILKGIGQKQFKKVVLARKSVFEGQAPIDGILLLYRIQELSPQTFHFYFQTDPDSAFLGAPPERLYRRKGSRLKSEALAGTRSRGKTPQEEERLEKELLETEKDQREHRFVFEQIRQVFQELCQERMPQEGLSVLKLARLQHLFQPIEGVLREKITEEQLLKTLHPTPAVGGIPREETLSLISQLEPFDRGWYASPLGWIGLEESDFLVAIRSALVTRSTLSVFTGAGIVEGSKAQTEWEEIENKLNSFLKVLW